MIDNQLHRHHRIDLGGVAALLGDGITQARQINQRGLAENVMTYDTGREPREVEFAFDFDDLLQAGADDGRIRATHYVLGVHARGVGQFVPGARGDVVDGGTRIEIVELGAGQ